METVRLERNAKLVAGTFVKVGKKGLVRCPKCKKLTLTSKEVKKAMPIPFVCDHCSWSVMITFEGL